MPRRKHHAADLPLVVPMKREFRDAYDRRAYLRACLLGKRLLDEPALLEKGRAFLERFVRDDPRQRRIYALWTDVLTLPVEQIVGQLLADDERGAMLRETAPVFVVIPAGDIRALQSPAA
jgi:hypothetical protein